MSADRRPAFPVPAIREAIRNADKTVEGLIPRISLSLPKSADIIQSAKNTTKEVAPAAGRLVAAVAAVVSGTFGDGGLGNPAFDAAQQFAKGGKPPAGEGFKPFNTNIAEAADKPVDKSPIPVEKDAQGRDVERLVVAGAELPPDVPMRANGVEVGHFYTQTKGDAKDYVGFPVTNNGQAKMWDAFQRFGGVNTWGFPVSDQWVDEIGRVNQAFQRGIFQVSPNGNVEWANVFDLLSQAGKDEWLIAARQTPKAADWSIDTGKGWEQVVTNHLTLLDQNPALKAAYLSDPMWLQKFGLPMAIAKMGNAIVVRGQRAVFQLWLEDVPWAKAGQVTIALGGDNAKEAGLVPKNAATPNFNPLGTGGEVNPPAPQPPAPTPEAPAAAFPREIGNLQRDGVVIHNRGTRIGVIDNREDPQNNWQAIVAVYKQYAPNDRFEFFFYDDPNDVPLPETLQTPYKYDPVWYWKRDFPEADQGRVTIGRASNGVWQYHFSLPFVRPENQNKLSRNLLLPILAYSYKKEDLFAKSPSNAAAISRQQALDPYNSGRMNFPLKVVYTQ